MLNKCKILLHCRTLSIYDSELKNVSSIILQSSAYNHLVFEKKKMSPLNKADYYLQKITDTIWHYSKKLFIL